MDAAAWTSHKTKDGKEYYYNASTGKSRWDSPAVATKAKVPAKTAVSSKLSSVKSVSTNEWTTHKTKNGKEYYYNASTGKSRWDSPDEDQACAEKKAASSKSPTANNFSNDGSFMDMILAANKKSQDGDRKQSAAPLLSGSGQKRKHIADEDNASSLEDESSLSLEEIMKKRAASMVKKRRKDALLKKRKKTKDTTNSSLASSYLNAVRKYKEVDNDTDNTGGKWLVR